MHLAGTPQSQRNQHKAMLLIKHCLHFEDKAHQSFPQLTTKRLGSSLFSCQYLVRNAQGTHTGFLLDFDTAPRTGDRWVCAGVVGVAERKKDREDCVVR